MKNLYKIKYFSASTTPNRHFFPIILRFSLIRGPFKSNVTYCRWMLNVILRKHHSWRNTEQTTAHCTNIFGSSVIRSRPSCSNVHELLLNCFSLHRTFRLRFLSSTNKLNPWYLTSWWTGERDTEVEVGTWREGEKVLFIHSFYFGRNQRYVII